MDKESEIRMQLESEISSAAYSEGQRLPTERELAGRFGVSHMTIRRAVEELVDRQIIIRRPRSGMFVGKKAGPGSSRRHITLLATDYKSGYILDSVSMIAAEVSAADWQPDVMRVSPASMQLAARLVRETPTIILDDQIFFDSPISQAVEQTSQPVVLIGGERIGSRPIACIKADDVKGVLLVANFIEQLHPQRVASLSPSHLDGYPDQPVLQALRTIGSRFNCITSLFAPTPPFANEVETAYETLQKFLSQNNPAPSVLFCTSEPMAIGALAALREAGLQVPNDVAVIAYGESYQSRFTSPSLTAINGNMRMQAREAVRLMKQMLADPACRPTGTIKVQPLLVVRQSTPKLSAEKESELLTAVR